MTGEHFGLNQARRISCIGSVVVCPTTVHRLAIEGVPGLLACHQVHYRPIAVNVLDVHIGLSPDQSLNVGLRVQSALTLGEFGCVDSPHPVLQLLLKQPGPIVRPTCLEGTTVDDPQIGYGHCIVSFDSSDVRLPELVLFYNTSVSYREMEKTHTYGGRIRQLRLAAGWTLRDLADEIPIDESYLSRIERGDTTSPSLTVLERVGRLLAEKHGMNEQVLCDDLVLGAGRIPRDIYRTLERHPRIILWLRSLDTATAIPDLVALTAERNELIARLAEIEAQIREQTQSQTE